MTIRKILNNNVIVTTGSAGQEIVAMGRGLAFGRKLGEPVDEARIEKVFTLSNREVAGKFQKILADIPMKHVLITEEIIEIAKKEYGKELNDIIYVSLSDHINSAIERYKSGIILKNPLTWDIKRFYREEFAIGERAVAILKRSTGLEFLIDEAAFIALHFVNSEINGDISNIYEITQVMEDLAALVRKHFGFEYDEESISYFRFISHLKFFAQRLLSGNDYPDDDSELLDMVRDKYPEAYRCTEEVASFVEGKYRHNISREECAYLTIHIERMRKTMHRRIASDE
jgi:beta-glucoside operon transcriptional antiterminator